MLNYVSERPKSIMLFGDTTTLSGQSKFKKLFTTFAPGINTLIIQTFGEIFLADTAYRSAVSTYPDLDNLAFRKLLNPFKWAEFILGFSIFLSTFMVKVALFSVTAVMRFALNLLNFFPLIGVMLFKWSTLLVTLSAAVVLLGLEWATHLTHFFINSVCSPIDTIFRPIINFFRADSNLLEKILMVTTSILMVVISISLVLAATGISLPGVLLFLKPAATFIAPVFTLVAQLIGVIATQVLGSFVLCLASLTFAQRLVSFKTLNVIWASAKNLFINAVNDSAGPITLIMGPQIILSFLMPPRIVTQPSCYSEEEKNYVDGAPSHSHPHTNKISEQLSKFASESSKDTTEDKIETKSPSKDMKPYSYGSRLLFGTPSVVGSKPYPIVNYSKLSTRNSAQFALYSFFGNYNAAHAVTEAAKHDEEILLTNQNSECNKDFSEHEI